MDAATESILNGLTEAMQAETDGHHFYLMAARTTADPKGREVFERLAAEELDHFRFLKAQATALRATGEPDASVRLGPRADLGGLSPIFSLGLRARIREAHLEMSALSIGIQLEQSAVDFYAGLAAQASSPRVRAFFDELSDWERGHRDALLRQQKELRDDYWAAGGFAPF
jgi:rubrerythrin